MVPVGPEQHHRKYLEECLTSIDRQSVLPSEVLLVDDMAGLPDIVGDFKGYATRIWGAPWRLGVSAAFNCGVALAEQELVLMLGADDWLEPECVEKCLRRYAEVNEPLGYYSLTVKYHWEGVEPVNVEAGDIQTSPCGAAMVTKALWRHTGGFPFEAGTSGDGALVSILIAHKKAGKLFAVAEGEPLYNYRAWPGSDTEVHRSWIFEGQSPIELMRHGITANWKQPAWGRYS